MHVKNNACIQNHHKRIKIPRKVFTKNEKLSPGCIQRVRFLYLLCSLGKIFVFSLKKRLMYTDCNISDTLLFINLNFSTLFNNIIHQSEY